MVLGLVFALVATFKGSRWWLIAVAIVLALMYLLRPVGFVGATMSVAGDKSRLHAI